MTRYEQGFMNKCAEHGVDGRTAMGMLKASQSMGRRFAEIANQTDRMNLAAILTSGMGGAVLGGMQETEDRKKQLKNALLGALIGGGGAYLGTRSSKEMLPFLEQAYHQLDRLHDTFVPPGSR